MISTSRDIPLVAVSVSVYRFLLAAYPAEFREEYGEDMLQLFRDCALRAVGQSGSEGMVRLWAVTLLDLIKSLFEEHLQQETNMSKSTFIRISGWALVLAGIEGAVMGLSGTPQLLILAAIFLATLALAPFAAAAALRLALE